MLTPLNIRAMFFSMTRPGAFLMMTVDFQGLGSETVSGDEFQDIPVGLQFEHDGLDKGGVPGDG
jgi:hypothetical protein